MPSTRSHYGFESVHSNIPFFDCVSLLLVGTSMKLTIAQFCRLLDEEINPKADFATLLIRIAKLNALPQPLKYKIGQIFVDYLYHHKVILPEEKHKVFIVFLLFFLFRATTDRDSLNPFDGIIYDLIVSLNFET